MSTFYITNYNQLSLWYLLVHMLFVSYIDLRAHTFYILSTLGFLPLIAVSISNFGYADCLMGLIVGVCVCLLIISLELISHRDICIGEGDYIVLLASLTILGYSYTEQFFAMFFGIVSIYFLVFSALSLLIRHKIDISQKVAMIPLFGLTVPTLLLFKTIELHTGTQIISHICGLFC